MRHISRYCATVAIPASAIESANIVGYMNIDRTQAYEFAGSMFTTPSGTGFYYLNDVLVTGAKTGGADFIQFLVPGTSRLSTDLSFYFDGTDWCFKYDSGDYDADDAIPDNYQIPNNIGFVTRFGVAGTKIQYAGAVQTGTNGTVDVERAQPYQIVVNPLPYAVDLTDLTITGAKTGGADFIQFFIPGTSRLSTELSYYYDGTDWCFKYDSGDYDADDVVPEATRMIQPGEGFMLRCGTAGAKVKFPAPQI